jgi:acetyl esterase/lipase
MSIKLPFLIVLASVLISDINMADDPQWQPLWPDTPPGVTTDSPNQADIPEILWTAVPSDVPTAAVVILPGGGYGGHALDHEGDQIARWFQSMGISSLICRYRVRGRGDDARGNDGKGYGHPYPMLDAQRAIQTLRARAGQWNVDPNRVGVLGFSAGGHLASTVSTKFAKLDLESVDPVARFSSRPDFCILCYPVIGFGKPYTHRGSQNNLLGKDAVAELVASLSNEDQVSEQTPPTFLFHTAEDKVVPAENSLMYFLACKEHGVNTELHVFPNGGHGLGLAADVDGTRQWPALCQQWLRSVGMIDD